MATRKILKNTSGSDIDISRTGLTIPAGEQIELVPQQFSLYSNPNTIDEITTVLNSEGLVVNDGNQDFPSDVGKAHLENVNGVIREHNDVTLLPGFGENAPELVRISDALIGFCMREGDEIFAETRLNNYAGNSVEFQIHIAIDNDVSDRWIQFEVNYWTTNGVDDKAANVLSGTLTMGPVEVPDTPWRVFESEVSIPASAFANGEKYLYVGIKRVTAAGKTAPANHPTVLRYCKKFWKVEAT